MNRTIAKGLTKTLRYTLKCTKKKLVKHSAEIAIAAGTGGLIIGVGVAIKNTSTAIKQIEQEKNEKGCDLTLTEKAKTTWKTYLPTIGVVLVSTGLIVTAHKSYKKQIAAITTLYSIAENSLKKYEEVIPEVVGEEKAKEVTNAVIEKKLQQNTSQEPIIPINNAGNVLCYDPYSGREFMSDPVFLEKQINKVNAKILKAFDGECPLNYWYNLIGLEDTVSGDKLGWNINDLGPYNSIEIDLDSKVDRMNRPCLVIDFNIRPERNF